jgi:hypothetical protein
VGFTGSRSLPASFAGLVAGVVGEVLAAGASVAVGCAAGADRFVRAAAPVAEVFSVASGRWGRGRAALVHRSAALVAAVTAEGPAGAFCGFVSSPCPEGLVPAPAASACFRGLGSGSWASLALAAGSGVPAVVVFWCAPAPVVLPAWPGGSWILAFPPFAGGFLWVPFAPVRLPGL